MQDLLTQALEHIKGQETGITALKLASLSLDEYPQVSGSQDLQEQLGSGWKLSVHRDVLCFLCVSGRSFVYEGCYGQGAEQLPALATGGGRPAQEESGNYKEPQDLNTITQPK